MKWTQTITIPGLGSWAGWLGWAFCCYAIFLLTYTILKGSRPQHAAKWMRFIEKLARARKRAKHKIDGYMILPAWTLLFAFGCVALFVWGTVVANNQTPSVYNCYDADYPVCWGVEKVEAPGYDFAFVNIATKEHREMRFCHGHPLPLYAGFVLKELIMVEGTCDWIDRPDLHFTIVRDNDSQWHSGPYASLTYDDFKPFDKSPRPVLAKNCYDTPDDTDTICVGGAARFEQELSQR
jgi:hypothetical protein